jgi:hypothetical protein
MSNSKLLKEAIADAKAVRETAIANAKIALEEAFTPRLQSILSQKLQQEMEDEEEADVNEEYGAEDTSDADSSGIDGDNKQPADDANSSSELAQGNPDTEVETAPVGSEEEETEVVKEGEEEGDDEESIEEGEYNAEGEEEVVAEEEGEDESEEDEDELDLESIIRELEEELDDEEEEEVEDIAQDVVDGHEEEMHEEEEEEMEETYSESEEEMHEESEEEDLDEEIDLNEILREMGYGEEEVEEAVEETVEENNELEEVKAELEAAMSTISELKSTINEVNLLNAKLLYTNKLFKSYDLTNEQKMKVVETLDRTGNVREVKLVFSTLAESFKFTGTAKKQKATKITESFASTPVASTAPSKEVIQESTNVMADRFKKLANIK